MVEQAGTPYEGVRALNREVRDCACILRCSWEHGFQPKQLANLCRFTLHLIRSLLYSRKDVRLICMHRRAFARLPDSVMIVLVTRLYLRGSRMRPPFEERFTLPSMFLQQCVTPNICREIMSKANASLSQNAKLHQL